MKIKSLTIDGFRCLQNFQVSFEDDITVIVGENDSGKTSLIEALKVITQNRRIEIDDFSNGFEKINIAVEIEDFVFNKIYQKSGNQITELPLDVKPKETFLKETKKLFEDPGFDITVPSNIEKIRSIAKKFGQSVRSNSNNETLRNGILDIVNKNLGSGQLTISPSQFPKFNNIQLDGRQFENVTSFLKKFFLKRNKEASGKKKSSLERQLRNSLRRFLMFIHNKFLTK